MRHPARAASPVVAVSLGPGSAGPRPAAAPAATPTLSMSLGDGRVRSAGPSSAQVTKPSPGRTRGTGAR
jgi:hypothetical protein